MAIRAPTAANTPIIVFVVAGFPLPEAAASDASDVLIGETALDDLDVALAFGLADDEVGTTGGAGDGLGELTTAGLEDGGGITAAADATTALEDVWE